MPIRFRCVAVFGVVTLVGASAFAQREKKVPSYYGPQPAVENVDLTMYSRIREEGFKHSHVMEFGAALADGIGPRLTGSPNMAKANAWTRDTLTAIGLSNAHLEDWGEFGMGWQQINTWARMVSPDPEPLWLQAAPWSPATNGAVKGEVVYVDLATAKLDELKGKLAGKIVLLGATRTTPDLTEPLFKRYTDAELAEMEMYPTGERRAGAPDYTAMLAERRRIAALRKEACERRRSGDYHTEPRLTRWWRNGNHLRR
jgi:carboxypeptidase Q